MHHIPDKYWYVSVYGIEYYIPWAEFLPGSSMFIKTTANARVVYLAFMPVATYMKITIKAHARHEFGYYGIRVWRTA